MKRISTIRKGKYFLTLLCLLVAVSVNAELRTQAVERFNGTTTFDGNELNKVSNGVYTNSVNHITFTIDNLHSCDDKRLRFNNVASNSSKTSNFAWKTESGYNVQVTGISGKVRGYQARLSTKGAYAKFNSGNEVKCNTNNIGTGGAVDISISDGSGLANPVVLTLRAEGNSTDFTMHTLAYTYRVTQDVPVFQYKSIAFGSEGGDVYSSWVSYDKASAAEATHEKYDANITNTTNGLAQTAYFKAVPKTGYVFIGWKRNAGDADYVSTNAEYNEELISKSNDNTAPATITLYAVFSAKNTPLFSGSNQTLNVGANQVTDFAFQYTSSSVPSADTNADFYYTIAQYPDGTTKEGSPDATKVVTYDPTTNSLTGLNSGTAVITFTHKESNNYYSASQSFNISVKKNTPKFTWSNEPVYYNTNYPSYFGSNQNETDLQYSSSDVDVATFANGGLTVYYKQGSTTLTATQAENYKWNAHTETRTITPRHVDNHLPLTITADNMEALKAGADGHKGWNNGGVRLGDGSGGFDWNDKYYIFTFSGIPNRISFNYEVTSKTATDITWYVAVSTNQSDWEQIWDVNSQSGSADIVIDNHDIRYIKLCYSGNFGGTFKDVHVSEYKAFSVSPISLDFGSNVMGQPCASKTITLTYANIGYKVTASTNDTHFTVSPTYLTSLGGEKYGTQEFTVSYSTIEEHTSDGALLTLKDELDNSTTVNLSGKTVGKLATRIEYRGQDAYDQSGDTLPNPFRVIDANGAEVVDAKITMTSSNIAVLWVSEDGVSSFTPLCGGYVTLTANYAGDETHQPSTLSKSIFVEKCTQFIEWQQSLMGFTATLEGAIDTTVLLTAKAMNDNGTATNIPITYTIADPSIATLIDNGNGTYSVQVTAVGETTITATTAEDDTYATESVTHSIRVRREGEACHSFAIEHANQLSMFMGGTTDELVISGLPDQLTFDAKRDGGAIGNGITIQYYDGSSWQDLQTIDLTGSWASYGPYTVPEAAKRLRFEGSGTLSRYVRNIYVTQKTYLRADVASIRQQATVHRAFESRFKVDFSDIPVIQYSISNTGGLGLSLTCDRDVTNNCGEYGTYTFTLFGIFNTPCTLSETIYLSTSAGHSITIPVEIEVTLSGTYTFNIESGTWDESSKWDKGLLPDDAAEAVVSVPVTLNTHADVYSLRIEGNGVLTIGESGGLTVYEGGVTSSNASQIHLISNHSGAGFLRISPHSSVSAPAVTTHYTTRSTLSTGANKDATWQYVGAPGDHCTITTDGSQWLYIWDEQNGWVRKSGTQTLTPFAGYALTQYGQPTYEWTSTMIVGNQDIVLTKTASGMNGENVFVNSYDAPIDVKRFTAEDFEGDMDKTLYLFNAGSWNQWNAGETDGSNLGKNGDDTPGHYCAIPALAASYMDPAYDITTIPPMQGVYVKTRADGVVIHLNYEKHVWNAADSHLNRPMRKAEQNEESNEPLFMRIRLQANSSNSGADRLYVIQDTLFSSEYDNGYDAPKEIADGLMNLYVSEPFGQAEVSCTDRLDGTQIGFLAGEDGDYSLRFTSIETTEPIYLKDMETGICVEIEDHGEYAFTAQPFSNNPARFMLLLTPAYSPDGPTTATDDAPQQAYPSSLKIFRNGHLYISISDQLYDMVGRRQ